MAQPAARATAGGGLSARRHPVRRACTVTILRGLPNGQRVFIGINVTSGTKSIKRVKRRVSQQAAVARRSEARPQAKTHPRPKDAKFPAVGSDRPSIN